MVTKKSEKRLILKLLIFEPDVGVLEVYPDEEALDWWDPCHVEIINMGKRESLPRTVTDAFHEAETFEQAIWLVEEKQKAPQADYDRLDALTWKLWNVMKKAADAEKGEFRAEDRESWRAQKTAREAAEKRK